MDGLILNFLIQLLILTGPALVITAKLIHDIPEENRADRQRRAEMRLARLHDLAYPNEAKAA